MLYNTVEEKLRALTAQMLDDQRDSDPEFDDLAKMAQALAGSQAAGINLLGPDDARHAVGYSGVVFAGTANVRAFCSHVVASNRTVYVRDTLLDHRFVDHPLVAKPPHIRRYIGVPVFVDGLAVGTVCAFGTRELEFPAGLEQSLNTVAALVANLLESRRRSRAVENLIIAVPDPWAIVDERLIVISANDAACELVGQHRAQVVGRSAERFVRASELKRWRQTAKTLRNSPDGNVICVESCLIGRNGKLIPVTMRLRVARTAAGSLISGTIRAVPRLKLPRRQQEALRWAACGKSDAEIAVLMGIAPSTVHNHIEAAKKRLGVATRIQAILAAEGVATPLH